MKFTGVSVIVPTLRETTTFITAIDFLLKIVPVSDIAEFLVVVCEKTNKESFKYIDIGKKLSEKNRVAFRMIYQSRPFFGGALRDAFIEAKGSHVIVETPDLNTAPETLPKLIELSKKLPGAIISCSRWLEGGGFINYNGFKKVWNKVSQKMLAALYLTHVTDFTYGVHLIPTVLCQALNFKELKHPINLEQIVMPLRLGVKIIEIPAVCRTLEKNVTVNPLLDNIKYLRPAFRWRFARKEELLRPREDYASLMRELGRTEEADG